MHDQEGDQIGFVVMGEDYQFISLKRENEKTKSRLVQCEMARTRGKEEELFSDEYDNNEIYFRITVEKGAVCSFAYSSNGENFKNVESEFEAKPGRWIGAKIGYFALREAVTNDSGTVDIDWFRIEKIN